MNRGGMRSIFGKVGHGDMKSRRYLRSASSRQKQPHFIERAVLEGFVQYRRTLAVSRSKERGKKACTEASGPFWKIDYHVVASSVSGLERAH